MCGRFTLHLPPELIAEIFGVPLTIDVQPRYNVAPAQLCPVVCLAAEGRSLVAMKWGLIPHWAQDARLGFSMINARGETVETKPAFRGSFRSRRCLVVADGFYEWRHQGMAKEPFYVTMKDGGPMPFAGLWDRWSGPEGEEIDSFTIITCPANELVAQLHERMPVIVRGKDFDTWLDPAAPPDVARKLLAPFPPERMALWRVGNLVNNPRIDQAECITRV